MKVSTYSLIAACGLAVAGSGQAQIVVDGTLDAGYGSALAVQTVQTQFGDDTGAGGGSELDAGYARIENGKLYLMFTGNLEQNFNKFMVFIDSTPGGQNVIDASNNPTLDPFNGGGWGNTLAAYDGFTFDSGFEADYAIKLNSGNFGGARTDLGFGIIGGAADDFDEYGAIFYDENTADTTNEGSVVMNAANANPFDFQNVINLGTEIEVGYDNSNVAGIAGGTQAADPVAAEAVTTGIEFAFDLADLGNPTGDIKISAMVNNGTSDYLSNQFLGGIEPADRDNDPLTPDDFGNLGQADTGDGEFFGRPDEPSTTPGEPGGLANVDLNLVPGLQYFTLSQGVVGLEGDYNSDGFVSQGDLDLVLLNWGDTVAPAGFNEDNIPGGGPFDSLMSQNELDGVLLNWGDGTPPTLAVPEPTSLALLGLGGLAMLRRRSA